MKYTKTGIANSTGGYKALKAPGKQRETDKTSILHRIMKHKNAIRKESKFEIIKKANKKYAVRQRRQVG
jgi:hypothetical protein